MVDFIHFRTLLEIVTVIQRVAAEVFHKHNVAHDELDLIGAWLKLIIQYHQWKKPEHSGTEEYLTKRGRGSSVGIISQHVQFVIWLKDFEVIIISF